MEMQPHEKLEFYLNNAFTMNHHNVSGFRGYDAAEPVVIQAEEFEMDLSWVDDDRFLELAEEYYHDGLERSCDEPYEPDDAYADGEALASIGWGTDEDYGSAEECY